MFRKYASRFLGPLHWWTIGLAVCLMVGCVVWWLVCGGAWRAEDSFPFSAIPAAPVVDRAVEAKIETFCGDCHALPRPESFPRNQWHDEVRKGYEFYARSGRSDLDPPPIYQTVAYYRSRAPEHLVFAKAGEVDARLRSRFRLERLDWGQENYVLPAVSYLRWGPVESGQRPVLLICDMRDGTVAFVDLRGQTLQRVVLARFDHPCRAEPCDLDGDGWTDLVVAELGSFYPLDHDRGRVVWLRKSGAEMSYFPISVADKLGRVADVRPVDVDADGDLDLVVAEFGHYRTGNILLLRNVAGPGTSPRFEPEQLDPRPGAIHVPILDLNGDGRPDFLALISQEYECLEAFVNQGDGRFRLQNLWAGPDLTFGSSGIELADLDQDGDMDVLLVNGDAFDNSFANPSHGVQWFENLGGGNFAYHRLADLPGAYRALPADFDLDGDLDVVVVTFLPPKVMPEGLRSSAIASVVLLEQLSPGEFLSRTLEAGVPCHATFEAGDFDSDGDVDFAIGGFLFPHGATAEYVQQVSRLTIWWNEPAAPNSQ